MLRNEQTAGHYTENTNRYAAVQSTAELVALYVQTPRENTDRISLVPQRHLLSHLELAVQLGAKVKQMTEKDIFKAITDTCKDEHITTLCMGVPDFSFPKILLRIGKYAKFLKSLKVMKTDFIIFAGKTPTVNNTGKYKHKRETGLYT